MATPGTQWSYSSGSTNIVSRVIKNTFDTLSDNFAFPRRALFDKLGMRSAIIEPDASGTLVGSSYMWAIPRDWARFGLLYLNDGLWEGERILPEGWVAYSTAPTQSSSGLYGAYFWLNSTQALYPSLPADLFECRGFVGQMVTMIPSKKLVVVRLGYNPKMISSSSDFHEYEYWTNDDHEEFILNIFEAVDYE